MCRGGIQELSWPGNIQNTAVCDKTFRGGKQVKQMFIEIERWSINSDIHLFFKFILSYLISQICNWKGQLLFANPGASETMIPFPFSFCYFPSRSYPNG
jgi:hypothetical protein